MNTRLWVSLKQLTWMTSDMTSITNRPPRIIARNSVCVAIDNAENRPPNAREPVSPMKIVAGLELYHRKPKHANAAHTAMMDRSSGSDTAYAYPS